jgi:hypothetical protein
MEKTLLGCFEMGIERKVHSSLDSPKEFAEISAKDFNYSQQASSLPPVPAGVYPSAVEA